MIFSVIFMNHQLNLRGFVILTMKRDDFDRISLATKKYFVVQKLETENTSLKNKCISLENKNEKLKNGQMQKKPQLHKRKYDYKPYYKIKCSFLLHLTVHLGTFARRIRIKAEESKPRLLFCENSANLHTNSRQFYDIINYKYMPIHQGELWKISVIKGDDYNALQ